MMYQAHYGLYAFIAQGVQAGCCPRPVDHGIFLRLMQLPENRKAKCFDSKAGNEFDVCFPLVKSGAFQLTADS